MPGLSPFNQSSTLLPVGRMHLKAQTGRARLPLHVGHKFLIKGRQTRPAFLSGLVSLPPPPGPCDPISIWCWLWASAYDWNYFPCLPSLCLLTLQDNFSFTSTRGLPYPLSMLPVQLEWVLPLATFHCHLQNHLCSSRVWVLTEGWGWVSFTFTTPGPRKASEILKGVQTPAELKWKVTNPWSTFYFLNKGEPVCLKQVDLLWNTQ